MKVLISSYHMNLVLHKFVNILKKKKIKIDRIIRNPSVKENELLKIIHKYDGVICSDDEFTKKVLSKAKKLKVISKWGSGIDSIDLNFAKKNKIKIYNSPGAFTGGVAQFVIGIMLGLTRKISINDSSVKNGKWEKFQGVNIENKRIGIIGLGNIGARLVKYLKGFNVKLHGNDKEKNIRNKFQKKGVEIQSLSKIFSLCDIIIICVDLNKSSYHLIKSNHLMKLNKDKILINVSRGPVVDNDSLKIAIKKKNFQVGFDVFEEEPLSKSTLSVLKKKNSILCSHNAFNTKEDVNFVHKNTINNLLKGLES